MTYTVTTEGFEGPLALLLSLIERREMDISRVSLAAITEEYVAHLARVEKVAPHELADFLVVASKLLYLKSKALLPEMVLEDEEDGAGLADQLRMYQRYAHAADVLAARQGEGREGYASPRQETDIAAFAPPDNVTAHGLAEALRAAIERARPYVELPRRMMERMATIEETIVALKRRIARGARSYFHELTARGSRAEVITGFLALLELLRQRLVRVEQQALFDDIAIEHT